MAQVTASRHMGGAESILAKIRKVFERGFYIVRPHLL